MISDERKGTEDSLSASGLLPCYCSVITIGPEVSWLFASLGVLSAKLVTGRVAHSFAQFANEWGHDAAGSPGFGSSITDFLRRTAIALQGAYLRSCGTCIAIR